MKKALLVVGLITGGILGYLFKDEISNAIRIHVEKEYGLDDESKDFADM